MEVIPGAAAKGDRLGESERVWVENPCWKRIRKEWEVGDVIELGLPSGGRMCCCRACRLLLHQGWAYKDAGSLFAMSRSGNGRCAFVWTDGKRCIGAEQTARRNLSAYRFFHWRQNPVRAAKVGSMS